MVQCNLLYFHQNVYDISKSNGQSQNYCCSILPYTFFFFSVIMNIKPIMCWHLYSFYVFIADA